MDVKRKLTAILIAGVLGLLVAIPAMAAPGDLLQTVTVPVASSSGIGIGIDYDGSNILYTNYGDETVYMTDLSGADLGNVALINPDGTQFSGGLNAIAYNFDDGMLYGGGWSSTDLYKTDLSTGVTTLVMANAVPHYVGFIDGLAWDPTDNTFWMSDDVVSNVEHLDINGVNIGGFDGQVVTGFPNSGLAVSLSGLLWYGTNGYGQIFALDTSTNPPTNLGVFASPGGRDEDMVCGPLITKADGTVVETLLSKDAYDNTFAVIEVTKGECTSPAEPPKEDDRFMTGGGSVFTADNVRVTHGFELNCDTSLPNNLQVNWGKGKNANRFHMESLDAAECSDSPDISEGKPVAGFDNFRGSGTGRLNGKSGASVEFRFEDAGEPGVNDTVKMTIWAANGDLAVQVYGTLDRGNHQAH